MALSLSPVDSLAIRHAQVLNHVSLETMHEDTICGVFMESSENLPVFCSVQDLRNVFVQADPQNVRGCKRWMCP